MSSDFFKNLNENINDFLRYLYPGLLVLCILFLFGNNDVVACINSADTALLLILMTGMGVFIFQLHRVLLEIWTFILSKIFDDVSLCGFLNTIMPIPGCCLTRYNFCRQAYLFIRGQIFYDPKNNNHWCYAHAVIHALYLTSEILVFPFILWLFSFANPKIWIFNSLSTVLTLLVVGVVLFVITTFKDISLYKVETRIASNLEIAIKDKFKEGGFPVS